MASSLPNFVIETNRPYSEPEVHEVCRKMGMLLDASGSREIRVRHVGNRLEFSLGSPTLLERIGQHFHMKPRYIDEAAAAFVQFLEKNMPVGRMNSEEVVLIGELKGRIEHNPLLCERFEAIRKRHLPLTLEEEIKAKERLMSMSKEVTRLKDDAAAQAEEIIERAKSQKREILDSAFHLGRTIEDTARVIPPGNPDDLASITPYDCKIRCGKDKSHEEEEVKGLDDEENEIILAHKLILSKNPFFATKFKSKVGGSEGKVEAEKKIGEIDLTNFPKRIVKAYIDYLYTGNLNLESFSPQELMNLLIFLDFVGDKNLAKIVKNGLQEFFFSYPDLLIHHIKMAWQKDSDYPDSVKECILEAFLERKGVDPSFKKDHFTSSLLKACVFKDSPVDNTFHGFLLLTSTKPNMPKEKSEKLVTEAISYFRMAGDYAPAIHMLGFSCPNVEERAKLYELAASKGYMRSKSNLAVMYFDGRGVHQDYRKAFELWSSVQNENVRAKLCIAECYFHGKGVKEDKAKAYEIIQELALREVPLAQLHLKVMFPENEAP